MLSIRFDGDREWWVSGEIFDRLFAEGLRRGLIRPGLAAVQHVANANGGLDVGLLDAKQGAELTTAIRSAAHQEATRLGSMALDADDQSYLAGIARLLEVIPQQRE
ncbi:hypothetical protein ACIBCN_30570 [Nocardia sp. NPDC051052]|uniref:hypothetical protein n=1 Tax=Nocardia sp. NPDC051052 TaxID=3364322 RepID=UPI0037967A90